jgi:hypothetical protein
VPSTEKSHTCSEQNEMPDLSQDPSVALLLRLGAIEQRLSGIEARLGSLELTASRRVEELEEVLKREYVTQEAFAPVRAIVYGMVGFILLSFLGALVTLVIVTKK